VAGEKVFILKRLLILDSGKSPPELSFDSRVDLWPAYYNIDADDEELIERFFPIVAEFEEKHIRRDNIWK
jgi:hypothetical protein